ncbi:MAG: isoleucine--tRNA ligase, partial [Planctomycetota bacterium]
MDYKKTLNLPRTDFPMRAGLLQKEPQIQKRWDKMRLYERVRAARKGAPRFILHDGPPYATGDLHIGTVMNKVLKDIVVRYQTMRGKDCPFAPGWDCHGLPIEHQVMRKLGKEFRKKSPAEIRQLCKEYASRYVDYQRKQFKRFGVLADWEHPYLTMSPDFEAGIMDVLLKIVEQGYVYRELRAIHWCPACETALAEAELEYKNIAGPSIYVKFKGEEDFAHAFGLQSNASVYV